MKNNTLKALIAALSLTVMVGALAGRGNSANSSSNNNSTTKTPQYSGTINADGSTALLPLAQEAAKQFIVKNPNATINVQPGGSGTGLKDVLAGTVEIGNSDIFAEEKLTADQSKALTDHKVCVVGFAVVVNSKVNVSNLTKQQVKDIFTGKVTNWKQVGGNDLKITIINRAKGSGTRATFTKYALDGTDETEGQALTQDSSGAVQKALATQDGGVSYLASSYTFDTANLSGIKTVQFDGVEMTPANIESGKYPIWSYEHMYTKGEAKDLSKAFIDYMSGNDFKSTVSKLGYIPISDMKTTR